VTARQRGFPRGRGRTALPIRAPRKAGHKACLSPQMEVLSTKTGRVDMAAMERMRHKCYTQSCGTH
jgi:hypothetical protein